MITKMLWIFSIKSRMRRKLFSVTMNREFYLKAKSEKGLTEKTNDYFKEKIIEMNAQRKLLLELLKIEEKEKV